MIEAAQQAWTFVSIQPDPKKAETGALLLTADAPNGQQHTLELLPSVVFKRNKAVVTPDQLKKGDKLRVRSSVVEVDATGQ